MDIQLVPTLFALLTTGLLFLAMHLYMKCKEKSILMLYKIYAAHILELFNRDLIEKDVALRYIKNLIPIYQLKFSFRYRMEDFFYDKQLFLEASEAINQLYQES